MKLSFDDEESFKEVVGSLHFNNPPSDPDSVALTLQEVGSTTSSRMPPQDSEWNEEIYFNNSPSDPNSLGRVGSTPPQERSDDFEIIPA
jgi:hypothetical protein